MPPVPSGAIRRNSIPFCESLHQQPPQRRGIDAEGAGDLRPSIPFDEHAAGIPCDSLDPVSEPYIGDDFPQTG
jgi:hypothetical protein